MRKIIGSLFQSLDGGFRHQAGRRRTRPALRTAAGCSPISTTRWTSRWGGCWAAAMSCCLARTYEIFAAYWPHNGAQPIGETFNAVRKHVVTSSDRPLTWNNSTRLVGDPAEAVARLKASDGPDLLIQGSSMLYQALLRAGLVDELALITFPVMLGRGKRWYSDDPATVRSWTLVEQTHSPNGVHF